MHPIVRKIACLLLAAGLLCTVTLPATAAPTEFYDVDSEDWFAPSVSYVVGQSLFVGRSTGYFAPELTMNRAMFYTVLCRMAGAEVSNEIDTNLSDVTAGSWYTGAVVWAISTGIADCRTDDAFGAYDDVPRWELCLALARFDALTAAGVLPEAAHMTFPDLGHLSAEVCAAIAACQSAGIVSGRSDGRFDPYASATRAHVAKVIANYHQQFTGAITEENTPPAEAEVLTEAAEEPVDAASLTGWAGDVRLDFPLSFAETVSAGQVNALNARILTENEPAAMAALGTTIDGNAKHLTNYGTDGLSDCINVTTCLSNQKSGVDAGAALSGQQEYYGYSLQVSGVAQQDVWHQAAQSSGKSPWQCTWWVWGRAAQYVDLAYGLDFTELCGGRSSLGNGGDYFASLRPYFLSDQTPSANSIVSWSCGTYGHVGYVEAVDDNGIWVSMADSGHSWRGITYIVKTSSTTNPYPLNWFSSERFNGFNHLDYAADGSPIGQ